MFVYTLLFTGLLALLGTSTSRRCRQFQESEIKDMRALIPKTNCTCEEAFRIDGDNQTECKCYQVPKDGSICNMTCFNSIDEFYHKDKKKLIRDFKKRAHECKDENITCFKSCGDMENVTASTFKIKVIDVMLLMNSNFMTAQKNNQ